ncbi:polyribonucleotide nucleotidyltransferase [Patescibacteria group bacterium]|nr:polyribonucleotide nucleotidyltransferase [Patescibacteria group bacterium]
MSYPTYGNTYKKDLKVGDKVITIEVGKFSEQASAAVTATCGGTMVLATVALGRKVDLGYFPLSVEYVEKLFAGGVIKGSRWVKRDGRPSDDSILKGRVIDRTMRPMFPEGMTNEVQIIVTVFSTDKENDADMLGLMATGVALQISDVPFDGPVTGLRVGYRKADDKYVFNPTFSERAEMDMDLIVSGTADAIVMVESGAKEVSEDVILKAFDSAQAELKQLSKEIAAIGKEIGKEKQDLVPAKAEDTLADVKVELLAKYRAKVQEMVKLEGVLKPTGLDEFVAGIAAEHAPAEDASEEEKAAALENPLANAKVLSGIFHELMVDEGRRMIVEDGIRPDGRKTDEIRQIWGEVDLFPGTHGSAMFKRGATQVVSVTTLGSPALSQLVEDMNGERDRFYIHHYNMPPFASGESGRVGSPKRREIGHGALAERALFAVIPSQAEFPYTIQVNSEVVSSNGSTSQASVCGSTMSLMAAGVPIKRPVAGIAMGLMTDGQDKFVVLSDIQGLEDHIGDMDFKVAGTSEGVTALQMDIKIKGIPGEVMKKALLQAKAGRMHIMGKMLEVIPEPRKELSPLAPKIRQLEIPQDRIGELIGPGGKNIKAIIEMTGAQIDVDEDTERGVGLVNIGSSDQTKLDHAYNYISSMMRQVEVGDEFDGEVNRIESYGAFVNITPGKDGLLHVSGMSTEFVHDANDIVKLGDIVHVRVSEIQEDGKIKLTMLTPEQESAAAENRRNSGGDRGGDRGDRGGRGGFGGGSRSGRPPFRGGHDRGGRPPRRDGGFRR